MHSAAHQVGADGLRGRRPLRPLVPPVLAGFRAEVDNIETATVRVPQRLRHILLVRLAASARACAIGVLAGVRWLSHQLGNGCQLAEQIPGPWQLFQTLQFGCSLLETRCGERIARGNALSPAALSKVPASCVDIGMPPVGPMQTVAAISPAGLPTPKHYTGRVALRGK